MPELPEIEHLRRTLAPALVGRRVTAVSLRRRDVVRASGRRPAERVTGRDLLRHRRVDALLRHGKQLALVADDGAVLCVHLGMSGQLCWVPPRRRPADPRHVHCVWHLSGPDGAGAGRMIFRDPRRFGGLWPYPSVDALRGDRWRGLGPDALTVRATALRRALERTTRPVKAVLLDQAVLAGVGNIYADEALFSARICPAARASSLSPAAVRHLAAAVRGILRASIDAGGSTLRDYVDANGAGGRYAGSHRVYGRGGQPCRACGTSLATASLGQRTTVWCPRCQPA